MMTSDGLILIALGIVVLLLTLLTEMAWRRGWLPQWLSRKVLHIGAIGCCALLPVWLQDLTILCWIVAVVEILLIYLVATRKLFSEIDGRRSWGIAFFPLAYVLLLFFAPDRFLIVVPMAILAVSDALAAIVGKLFARRFFQLTGDRKSLLGSLAFLVSAWLVIWASQYIFSPDWIYHDIEGNAISVGLYLDDPLDWVKIGFVALLLSALEAMGSNGFDNLWIPLAAALLLQHSFQNIYINGQEILGLWVGVGVAIGFIWFTVRRHSLSWNGAIAAAVMGLWVLFFSGVQYVLLLFFFFATSTLLGRLTKSSTVISDAKHGKARDYRQVLCNGGIFAALAPFGIDNLAGIGMMVSLAVCTADTWASEIGMYFRGPTYDLLRWRPTTVGLSGGVSWAGTLGGFLGAAAMAAFTLEILTHDLNIQGVLTIAAAGFLGMLIDSLLGATLQARYRNEETGELTDLPTKILHSGYPWMSNDAVNLLSNLLTVLLAGLCFLLFL